MNVTTTISLIPHPDYIPASLNNLALEVATDAHRDQKRWGGQPYIIHPKAVGDALPKHLRVLGYLHDVLEDQPDKYPLVRLQSMFPPWVTERIVILSKAKGQEYDDFILRTREDEATRLTKIADILDNLKDLKHGSMRDKYRLALRLLGEKP